MLLYFDKFKRKMNLDGTSIEAQGFTDSALLASNSVSCDTALGRGVGLPVASAQPTATTTVHIEVMSGALPARVSCDGQRSTLLTGTCWLLGDFDCNLLSVLLTFLCVFFITTCLFLLHIFITFLCLLLLFRLFLLSCATCRFCLILGINFPNGLLHFMLLILLNKALSLSLRSTRGSFIELVGNDETLWNLVAR